MGADLIAISPTLPKFAAEVREQHRLPFEVLSDLHNEVAGRFGLVYKVPDDVSALYKSWGLNLPEFNADESWTLPMPARFVVSQDGIIRKADVDPDYTRRPEPDETARFLRAIIASGV